MGISCGVKVSAWTCTGAVALAAVSALAAEPEPKSVVDPGGAQMVVLQPHQRLGPQPRGVDFDPFPPCTLDQGSNCQNFEYPRVGGTSYGSAGLGVSGFPNGFSTNRVCDHIRPIVTGNVTNVCWWGTYGNPPAGGVCGDMPTDPNVDNFVITYYARNSVTGLPDTSTIIGGPFVQDGGGLTVSRVGLCDTGGRTSAAYTATHAPVHMTANTCYFIEIRNLTDGVQSWFWSRTFPPIDNVCYRDIEGTGYDATEAANDDRAFCVGITQDPFGSNNTQICLPPVAEPPANDNCSTATAISGPGATNFDNTNGTTGIDGQANAACAYTGTAGNIERDVWFNWTAAAPGFSAGQMISVTVTTCGSGIIIDSKMAVYNAPTGGGSCPQASDLIDCTDDVCASTPVNNANVAASVSFNAIVGNHYIFQVGGAALGAAGIQTLTISAGPAKGRCCLPNGDCAVVNQARCAALSGTYGGDGTSCGSSYTSSTGTNAVEDIGATGTALSFVQGDDDGTTATIPFPFRFYGEEFTSITVGVNGQAAFGPLYPFANTWPIPTHQVEPNSALLVAADDFLTPPGGGCGDVRVETRGTAPNRRFIIQWNQICHFSDGTPNLFQAILFENGNIEYRYGSMTAPEIIPTGGTVTSYVIGIESESGAGSIAIDNGSGVIPAAGSSILFTYASDPSDTCPNPAACPCDFDASGSLNSADFFSFLTAFFNSNPTADFDHSGSINSADFFAFLTCFFQPPTGCH